MRNDNIQAYDRGNYGSGHGWSGATIVYWNCTVDKLLLEKPATEYAPHTTHQNYAIGCIATLKEGRYPDGSGAFKRYKGFIEALGSPIIKIPSLYQAQLKAKRDDITATITPHKLQAISPFYLSIQNNNYRDNSIRYITNNKGYSLLPFRSPSSYTSDRE